MLRQFGAPLRWGIFLALVCSSASCGLESRSAGSEGQHVQSVEGATNPAWGPGEGWRVAATPIIAIGSTHGPAEYTFGDVRAATAFPSGTIAIADNSTKSIGFFDLRGNHIRSVGREGDGPGEYRFLPSMARTPHDSLIVADGFLQRITVLDSAGAYVRSFRMTGAAATDYVRRIEAVGDGYAAILPVAVTGYEHKEDGLVDDTVTVWALNLHDGRVHSVSQATEGQSIIKKLGGNQLTGRIAPFPTPGFVAAGSGAIAVGASSIDDIRTYDAAGMELARMEAVRPMPLVEPSDIRRFYEAMVPSAESRARLRRSGDMDLSPPRMPAFDDLLIDPDGNVWVRRYSPPWAIGPSRWDVHEPGGRWLGTIDLPTPRPVDSRQRDLLEVGRDYVLILLVDSVGVQRVGRYALQKPARDKSVD